MPPLLHPRLALLDPAVGAGRLRRGTARQTPTSCGRLRLIASTAGACLTLAFAAHVLEVSDAPPPSLDAPTTSETAQTVPWVAQ